MMNLKSLLNSNEDGSANQRNQQQQQQQQQHPGHPQQQQHPGHPQQQTPSTPVQPGPSPVFRDYSGPVHASPRGHSLSDYAQSLEQHRQQQQQQQQQTPRGGPGPQYAGSPAGTPGPGGPPTPYGAPRPVPPPLQHVNSGDLRSPGGPSPYRHTPSSSVSAGTSGGYPFPPAGPPGPGSQGPPPGSSPVQHHQQYPPGGRDYPPQQQRDSYGGYSQQQPPPQTPPIGPGSSAFPPHQRSHSTHSTPTPTSAHSQHGPPPPGPPGPPGQGQPPYGGAPYGQVSPVVQHRQGPPHPSHQSHPYQQQHQQQHQQPPFDPTRPSSHSQQQQQQSPQPPTPLGPPLSAQSQSQQQQQRNSAAPGPGPSPFPMPQHPSDKQMAKQQQKEQKELEKRQLKEQKEHQKQQQQQQKQHQKMMEQQQRSQPASPLQQRIPHPPPPGPPMPSHPSDPSHRRSTSRSDRAPSVSVSPKTRVPSLPSGSTASSMARPTSSASATNPTPMDVDSQSGAAGGVPSKRKMDERDLHPDEVDRRDVRRPAPFEGTNGTSHLQEQRPTTPSKSGRPLTPAAPSSSSTGPRDATPKQKRKPTRYTEVPTWARKYDGGNLKKGNLIVFKPGEGHRQQGHANGSGDSKKDGSTTSAMHSRHTSRQGSPEAGPSQPPGGGAPPTGSAPPDGPPATGAAPSAADARAALLAPWEESVTGDKPYEELSRKVADFLFLNVVSNPNMIEIQGLGVQFEIEAKLGQLISKDTNQRMDLPVATECLLQDNNRVTFKSSMTEVQHKAYNEFLNGLVVATDARNPINAGRARPRVPVVYKHRREIDRFFELPLGLQERLPACVRNLLPHRYPVKVRVTYDKKTGDVLAKIVKARISDLNIFFPDAPLDCRLSVNLEMDWEGTVEELEQLAATMAREQPPDREKDRLSYTQSHYQIDLTQVTYKIQGPQKMEREEKEHELEIELAAKTLIEQGRRARNGEPHAYPELVEGLVDNVRILARRAKALGM